MGRADKLVESLQWKRSCDACMKVLRNRDSTLQTKALSASDRERRTLCEIKVSRVLCQLWASIQVRIKS